MNFQESKEVSKIDKLAAEVGAIEKMLVQDWFEKLVFFGVWLVDWKFCGF